MAQYSDYLKYLQHVDDTTARDMENRENALRNEFKEKLALSEAESNRDKNAMEARYKDEISRLREEKDSLSRKSAAELDNCKRDYEQRLAKQNSQFVKESDELKAGYKAQIEKLNDQHRSEIEKLKVQMEELERDQMKTLGRMKDTFENRLSNLNMNNAREKSKIMDEHRDEVARLNGLIRRLETGQSDAESNLRATYEKKLDAQKKLFDNEKNVMLGKHAASLKNLEQGKAAEIARLTDALNNERKDKSKIVSDLNARMREIRHASDEQVKRVVEEADDRIARVQQTAAAQLKQTIEANGRQISELEQSNATLRKKLSGFENGSNFKRLKLLLVVVAVLLIGAVVWGFLHKGSAEVVTITKTDTVTVTVEKDNSSASELTARIEKLETENQVLKKQIVEKDAALAQKNAQIAALKKEINLLNKVFNNN